MGRRWHAPENPDQTTTNNKNILITYATVTWTYIFNFCILFCNFSLVFHVKSRISMKKFICFLVAKSGQQLPPLDNIKIQYRTGMNASAKNEVQHVWKRETIKRWTCLCLCHCCKWVYDYQFCFSDYQFYFLRKLSIKLWHYINESCNFSVFTRLRSRRVVMCLVVVYVRLFVCLFVRLFLPS